MNFSKTFYASESYNICPFVSVLFQLAYFQGPSMVYHVPKHHCFYDCIMFLVSLNQFCSSLSPLMDTGYFNLSTMNNIVANIGAQVSESLLSVHLEQNCCIIASNTLLLMLCLTFLRNEQSVFHSSCTILVFLPPV